MNACVMLVWDKTVKTQNFFYPDMFNINYKTCIFNPLQNGISATLFQNFLNLMHYERHKVIEMNMCIRELKRFLG